MRLTRRAALVSAVAGLAGAPLAGARAARAEEREDDTLEDPDTLRDLMAREQQAAFAYRAAAAVAPALGRLGAQESDHARALHVLLEAFTLTGEPAPPRDAAELDAAPARLARATARDEALAAALALEHGLLQRYAAAMRQLRQDDVLRTAATVMASHGQHLTVLRRSLDRRPLASALEAGG